MTYNDHIIRGEKLSELMKGSFADAVYLIVRGEKSGKTESKLFEAMLISSIDHGMGTASSMSARFAASGGVPVNAGIAAGVLALGEYHGGAIEGAMNQLVNVSDAQSFVKKALDEKQVIYGFGHKVYKDVDPRAQQLLEMAKKEKFASENIELAENIEKELEDQKGKKLVLNIDGAIAALLLAMGFTPKQGKAIFVIARTPGLAAQVVEEIENEKPVRRIDESDISYEGK